MKKIIRFLYLSIALILCIPSTMTYAEDNNEKNVGFSVSPLSIETGEPQSSYYDLKVTPNEQKNIVIRVFNSGAEEIEVKAEVNNASTNNNGITSYHKAEKRDNTLKVGLADFTTSEVTTIKVPAKGYTDAKFNMTIPVTPFKGEILGGIRFTSDDVKAGKSDKGASVTNNMAYTVGVLLHETEDNIEPQMKLNKVITEQRNSRNFISANLQNTVPRIIKNLGVKAEITKKGHSKVLYEVQNTEMRMAPNSNFYYGINLGNHRLKSGNYTMKLSGVADGTEFNFEKDFSISQKEASKLNNSSVFVDDEEDNTMLLYTLIVLILCLLVAMITYIVIKKKKHKEV